jgi:hypothetical protein
MKASSQWKSEAQYQAACVKEYYRIKPQAEWDRLIGIYNNPPNAIVGSLLLSLGIKRGISDLLYFPGDVYDADLGATIPRHPAWIELKILGGKQSPSQLEFQKRVEGWGHDYHLCIESLELFNHLINLYL